MARLRTIEEEKKKKGGQGNKGRTSKKKTTPKKDMKIAQLREVAPGIAGGPNTLKLLKDLGIDPAELVKKSSSGMGDHYNWKGKKR